MQFNFIDTHNSTCNWLILSPTVTWTNGGIQEQVQILWCAVDMDCNLNFLLIWIWVCWNRRRRRYIGEVVVDRGERKQISMPFKCIQEESVYLAVILYRRTETRQNKFRSCLLLEWTISSYLSEQEIIEGFSLVAQSGQQLLYYYYYYRGVCTHSIICCAVEVLFFYLQTGRFQSTRPGR